MLAPLNVLVSNDRALEPALALTSGQGVFVAYTDQQAISGAPGGLTGHSISTDQGKTFGGTTILSNSRDDNGKPSVTYDANIGRLYVVTQRVDVPHNALPQMMVHRSDDGGNSFQTPVVAMKGFQETDRFNQPKIVVDTSAGAGQGSVYLLFRVVSDVPGKSGLYFLLSTNSGGNWSSPQQLSSDATAENTGLVVGPDHSVDAFWMVRSGDHNTMVMRRSTTHGATFGPLFTVATEHSTNLGLTGVGHEGYMQAAVNPVSGDLYVTFAADPAGPDRANVFMTISSDNGGTWTAPQLVSDDAGTSDQWRPTLAVAPDGKTMFVGYEDRRLIAANVSYDTAKADLFGTVGTINNHSITFAPSFRITDSAGGLHSQSSDAFVDAGQAVSDANYFYFAWASPFSGVPSVYLAKISTHGAAGPYVTGQTTTYEIADRPVMDSVDVTFSQPMDKTSFDLGADITSFTNASGDQKYRLTGYSWLDDRTLQIKFAPLTAPGAYHLVLGPQIRSAAGKFQDNSFNHASGQADDGYDVAFDVEPRYQAYAAPVTNSLRLKPGGTGVHFVDPNDGNVDLGTNTFTSNGQPLSQLRIYLGDISTAAPQYRGIASLYPSSIPTSVYYAFRDETGDGKDDLVLDYFFSDGSERYQAVLELNTGGREGSILLNLQDIDDPKTSPLSGSQNSYVAMGNSLVYHNGYGDIGLHSGMGLLMRDERSGDDIQQMADTTHVFGTPGDDTISVTYKSHTGFSDLTRNGVTKTLSLAGNVFLHGREGNDQLTLNNVRPGFVGGLDGNEGDDVLIKTGSGSVMEFGGAGNDSLGGGGYADQLEGGPGNDLMRGYGGNDAYYFGAKAELNEIDTVSELAGKGTDRLDFSMLPATQKAFVDLRSDSAIGQDGLRTIKTAVAGQATYFENADGGAGNDHIVGNSSNNVLHGYAGDDTLLGAQGKDLLIGGSGDDTLTGGLGDDRYFMTPVPPGQSLEQDTVVEAVNEGNDTLDFSSLYASDNLAVNLNGLQNNVIGQHNHFRLLGSGANFENVIGGAGNDSITGSDSDNFLYGNGGYDTLLGRGGNDQLFGGDGNDILIGGAGDDSLRGGNGDDRYLFAAPPGNVAQEVDAVFELAGGGIDELDFSALAQTMPVSVNLGKYLLATQSGRKVWTGAGTSFLDWENATGGAGDDTLIGNSHDNRLVGGPGNDTLQGGGGTDQLVQ